MTLDQLDSLTEDELVMALYIVNHLFPVSLVGEISPRGLTWFRKGELEKKIQQAFPHIKREAHPVFSGLLNKLGLPHEIRYEQPPAPQAPTGSNSVTSSV